MAKSFDSKHRDESETYAIDFANRLASGETLSTVVAVRVHDSADADVSSEFGTPTGSISGTEVQFTLGATSAGDQVAGNYRVYCEVTTSDGETLVETPRLVVVDTVSTT